MFGSAIRDESRLEIDLSQKNSYTENRRKPAQVSSKVLASGWKRFPWSISLTDELCGAEQNVSLGSFLQLLFLFAAVEGEHAFVIGGALKHFRMTQRPNRVVIAGAPMLLHAGAGEFVIF